MEIIMNDFKFGFIGLGLIGGSIAKALKHTMKNCQIIAYDTDSNALDASKKQGICNEIFDFVSSDGKFVFGEKDIKARAECGGWKKERGELELENGKQTELYQKTSSNDAQGGS